jgi:hypothetical protein
VQVGDPPDPQPAAELVAQRMASRDARRRESPRAPPAGR